jgi:hypothetical protein
MFGRLKDWRRVVTRHDHRSKAYFRCNRHLSVMEPAPKGRPGPVHSLLSSDSFFSDTSVIDERIGAHHDKEAVHVYQNEPALEEGTRNGRSVFWIEPLATHHLFHELLWNPKATRRLPSERHRIEFLKLLGYIIMLHCENQNFFIYRQKLAPIVKGNKKAG